MSILNISDLPYIYSLDDTEQLTSGGFWQGWGIEQDNDAYFKVNAKGDVNQIIIASAQGNNIGGNQAVIANAQGNLVVGGSGVEQDNDLDLGVGL